MDGGAQVRLVGGTGYVVVGVVAEERGVAEGVVEGGGEEGEEEEEEGSGWFCEGEHVLFFGSVVFVCRIANCQLPRLSVVIFSNLFFSSRLSLKNQVANKITLSHPLR